MSHQRRNAALTLATQKSLVVAAGKYHGLGNRVRAVLGSEVLARLEGRGFAYAWPTGPAFGARLDELWEYDRPRLPVVLSRALAVGAPYRDNTLGWLDAAARHEKLWQIRTPHALHLPASHSWEDELQTLRPVPEVRRRVERIFESSFADRPYVGVMVRTHAHSHEATRLHSPIEWFLTRMTELRQGRPDIGFFLSADTDDAVKRIQHMFPDAVSQADKGAYNSKDALVASVADLYLLASSSHVLAPHFSSFPELAGSLAGPELHLETSQSAVTFPSWNAVSRVDEPLTPSLRHSI